MKHLIEITVWLSNIHLSNPLIQIANFESILVHSNIPKRSPKTLTKSRPRWAIHPGFGQVHMIGSQVKLFSTSHTRCWCCHMINISLFNRNVVSASLLIGGSARSWPTVGAVDQISAWILLWVIRWTREKVEGSTASHLLTARVRSQNTRGGTRISPEDEVFQPKEKSIIIGAWPIPYHLLSSRGIPTCSFMA